MAQQRVKTAELARLFNSFDQPVYVLDDELTIRFCNEPCAAWTGLASGELLGHRCSYDASTAGADDLCPPPKVLDGHAVTGVVAATAAEGPPRRRRAWFVPLGPAGTKPLAIVALVDPTDLDPDQTGRETESLEPAEPDADELHDLIRQFRVEAAGRCGADRLIGDSPAMRLARARIALAAKGHGSVLIAGPVGSGRQHVAHAVHYARDPDREGTLIPVDCAVLGPDLIRSTIDALAANPLGQRAARSTLLLSEVDLLPPEVHAGVAATIAARSFLPAVVATAAVSPGDLAARGQYDAQLAALLSTTVIRLPALADRREDIPLLAQSFLEQANQQNPRQIAGFTPEALDRLDAYHWPGNLDELAAVVREAMQDTNRREIEPRHLPKRLQLAADAAAHPKREDETIQLDELLGRVERELIARAMAKAKGNKTKAATLLGMTRPRLYRRLVQLGLEEEEQDP